MARRVFVFFNDTEQRRRVVDALSSGKDVPPDRYALYGLDELDGKDLEIQHNLEEPAPVGKLVTLSDWISRLLVRFGGYGGNFASAWKNLGRANRCDVVLSTVDTVGIPLVLMRWLGLLKPPLRYISIGLPGRMERLRGRFMKRVYRKAFSRVEYFAGYGWEEVNWMKNWLNGLVPENRFCFIPFGVEEEPFGSAAGEEKTTDVLSVGADWQRDYEHLVSFARQNPDVSIRMIVSPHWEEQLGEVPANVELLVNEPLSSLPGHLAQARVVALPVKENPYSGATTTLLQALAAGRPVVVSSVGAIREGYGFVDGEHLRFAVPGSEASFCKAVKDLLENESEAEQMGENGAALVRDTLSWPQFVGRVKRFIQQEALPHEG